MRATDREVEPHPQRQDETDDSCELEASRDRPLIAGDPREQHECRQRGGRGEAGGDVVAQPETLRQRLAHRTSVPDQVARARGGERDQDREAEAAADLAGGVHEPRGETRLALPCALGGDDRRGHD